MNRYHPRIPNASALGVHQLGIELNEEYIMLSRERIERETAQQTLDF